MDVLNKRKCCAANRSSRRPLAIKTHRVVFYSHCIAVRRKKLKLGLATRFIMAGTKGVITVLVDVAGVHGQSMW
jgi:hypothetical protein